MHTGTKEEVERRGGEELGEWSKQERREMIWVYARRYTIILIIIMIIIIIIVYNESIIQLITSRKIAIITEH